MIAANGVHVQMWGAPLDSCTGVIVAVHGITANAHALRRLAMHLDPQFCVIAPDLRGRGESYLLDGPFGIERHADDVVAVLDELDIDAAMWVGHSMGAFVSSMAGAKHPDRVTSVVMIDGGLPAPFPDGAQPTEVLTAMLGPTVERLGKTFDSFDEYVAFWQTHPAMAEIDDEYLREYSAHDVEPDAAVVRSRVNADAVWTDGEQLMVDDAVRSAAQQVTSPMLILRATRGILNQAEPRIPTAQAEAFASGRSHVRVLEVPDTNHFSIVATPDAVAMVAKEINNEGKSRVAR